MTRRQVSIHGHAMAYRVAGDGPALVLLHGMAGSAETWRRIVPSLAARFTVVAPDLLGHGASAKPPGEYSLGAHANAVRDLLVLLGLERATVVGHSFGGGVAMQLAYQYPERCQRLVLVSSGGLGQDVNLLLRTLSLPGAEQVFPLLCSPGLRDAGDALAARLGRIGLRASPVVEEIWRSYSSLTARESRQAFFRTLRAVIDHTGQAVSAADRLYLTAELPTLVVWGARDSIIPVEHAHSAHRAMPGSRLEIFDDAGHYPHCEAPERFAETLLGFIESTEPAALTAHRWNDLLRNAAVSAASESATPMPSVSHNRPRQEEGSP
jgi:pimeloyl-ACP methyl ester carboxylesterase